MGKLLEELKATDRVVVEFGEKKQYNDQTGETTIIDPAKQLDVNYAYYDNIVSDQDDYIAATAYFKPIGRTVKLLGLAVFSDKSTAEGDTHESFTIEPLDTHESRYEAKLQQEAYDKAKADLLAQQKRDADAQAKLQQDIKEGQRKLDEAAKTAKTAADKAEKDAKTAQTKSEKAPDNVELKQAADDAKTAFETAKAAAEDAQKLADAGPVLA